MKAQIIYGIGLLFIFLYSCKKPSIEDLILTQINLYRSKPVYEPKDKTICGQEVSPFTKYTCSVSINHESLTNPTNNAIKEDLTLEVIKNIVNSCKIACPECFDSRMDIICIEYDSLGIALSFIDFSDPNLKSIYLESKSKYNKLENEDTMHNNSEPVKEDPYELREITLTGEARCINLLGVLKCNLIKTSFSAINKLDSSILNYVNENSILIFNVIDLNEDSNIYYHYKCDLRNNTQVIDLVELDTVRFGNKTFYIYKDSNKYTIWDIGESLTIEICDSIRYTKGG